MQRFHRGPRRTICTSGNVAVNIWQSIRRTIPLTVIPLIDGRDTKKDAKVVVNLGVFESFIQLVSPVVKPDQLTSRPFLISAEVPAISRVLRPAQVRERWC